MTNEIFDGTNMIGQFLRERQRGTPQPGNPLSSGAVKTLTVIGLAGELRDGAVVGGGNDLRVNCIGICIEDRVLPIDRGKLIPQGLSALTTAVIDLESDDLSGCRVQ